MKKCILLILCIAVSLCLLGCSVSLPVGISCETVTALYEKVDYQVFHADCTDGEPYSCYVKAEDPATGEYVFFYFFDSEQSAQEYAGSHKWSLGKWFDSLLSGDPTWIQVQAIGNVVCEYDGDAILKIFQSTAAE